MDQALRTYIQKQIEEEVFSGAIFAVSHKGEIISQGALGAEVEEAGKSLQVNHETMVDLASVTKIYTSTLLLKLVSDEQCALDTKVTSLLPDVKAYPLLKEKMDDISLYDLLTHSSGIQAWFPFYSEKELSFYEIIDSFVHIKQSKNHVEYSDINYMLIGKVIEEITGLPLDQAIEENLKKPLGMKKLTYGPIHPNGVAATGWGNKIEQDMCIDRKREFTNWRSSKKPIRGEVNDGNCHYYFNGVSGHAGLFAPIRDVIRLGELYLKDGKWNNKQYINQQLIHQSIKATEENRGLGWEIGSVFPEGCGHTGFTGTSLWIVPERELAVALLTNRLHVESPVSIQYFRAHVHELIIKEIDKREGKNK